MIRIFSIVISIVIELAMVILCLVLGIARVSPDSTDDDPGITFLTMHASEILAAKMRGEEGGNKDYMNTYIACMVPCMHM